MRNSSHHASSPQDIVRNEVLAAIGRKWSKFSGDELSRLTTIDELVSQIMSKYGMDKTATEVSVQILMAGRNL